MCGVVVLVRLLDRALALASHLQQLSDVSALNI